MFAEPGGHDEGEDEGRNEQDPPKPAVYRPVLICGLGDGLDVARARRGIVDVGRTVRHIAQVLQEGEFDVVDVFEEVFLVRRLVCALDFVPGHEPEGRITDVLAVGLHSVWQKREG